jgi:hypothetical protein
MSGENSSMLNETVTLKEVATREARFFPEGNFSFVTDRDQQCMLREMYDAVTAADAWDYLQTADPAGGFAFGSAPEIDRINAALQDTLGHSGTSFTWTILSIQRLARIGWQAFVAETILRQETAAMAAEPPSSQKDE